MKVERLRQSGIGLIGEVPWGTHFFLFHEKKQDLIDACVPYFRAGLENHELCMWVIADPLTEDEARYCLKHAIPAFERYLDTGSIEIVRGPEWYMTGEDLDLMRVATKWKQKTEYAIEDGYDGFRLSADTAWLEKRDWKAFSHYEREVNETILNTPMLALCTYPLVGASAAEILDVTRAHQFAIARRNSEWEVVETPQLKETKAEILRLNNFLERRVAEKTREVAAANEDLKAADDLLNASFALTARLQDIQEAERQLVARLTHDRLGRALSSIEMDLRSLIQNLPSDQPSGMKAKSILRLVEETIESARRIAKELRPGSPHPETRQDESLT